MNTAHVAAARDLLDIAADPNCDIAVESRAARAFARIIGADEETGRLRLIDRALVISRNAAFEEAADRRARA